VVAFDCPTGPAVILEGGRCGVLVPAGDTAALTDGIRRLITDEGERRRLADAAALRARDFDVELMADRWEELFAGLGDARGLSLGR
jgi:glycosyltransferase involved in cell wall biosynthesis